VNKYVNYSENTWEYWNGLRK